MSDQVKTTDLKVRPDKIIKTVALVVVCGFIFGYFGYLYGKNNAETTATNVTSSTTPTITSSKTATATSTATAVATADWKTYTNDTYGFSFKYPKDWSQDQITQDDTKNMDAELLTFAGPGASKNIEHGGPYGIANVYVYKSLVEISKRFDVNASSIKDLADKLAAKSDPFVKDVKSSDIGNLEGYTAVAGPNAYGGGKYYFAQDESGQAFEIHVFTEHSSYNPVTMAELIGTFQFTK